MRFLKKLWSAGRVNADDVAPFPAIAPTQDFYAIGDIHGCFELLCDALERIDQDAADPVIVCVGDYVDRGEQSREVLQMLRDQSRAKPGRFICLKGNHEQMMLGFLDNPAKYAARWLGNGGLQTLASFQIGRQAGQTPTDLRDAFIDTVDPGLIGWLRARPSHWISGNVAVTHAGADPGLPIDMQADNRMIWGHPDFARLPRRDGIWVVHGHTIVPIPQIEDGRIAIDTGAYATGVLTVARIGPQGVSFLPQAPTS